MEPAGGGRRAGISEAGGLLLASFHAEAAEIAESVEYSSSVRGAFVPASLFLIYAKRTQAATEGSADGR
jgi:hypothetical protein